MHHLTHQQLQRMFLQGFKKIMSHKLEINSINIFPVADQDTGSNLAKTVAGISTPLQSTPCRSLTELSTIILKQALSCSQGNSGIIFSAFLDGFFSIVKDKTTISTNDFLKAFIKGSKTTRSAIEHPEKGTILDVMDAIASLSHQQDITSLSFIDLLEAMVNTASSELKQTTNHMALLKQANVVDAGGLGFVYLLEGFYEALTETVYHNKQLRDLHLLAKQKNISIDKNKYEVIFVIEDCIMVKEQIKTTLSELGDSLDIAEIEKSIKVHIHTDTPLLVKDIAQSLGDIKSLQIIDMESEVTLESINNL